MAKKRRNQKLLTLAAIGGAVYAANELTKDSTRSANVTSTAATGSTSNAQAVAEILKADSGFITSTKGSKGDAGTPGDDAKAGSGHVGLIPFLPVGQTNIFSTNIPSGENSHFLIDVSGAFSQQGESVTYATYRASCTYNHSTGEIALVGERTYDKGIHLGFIKANGVLHVDVSANTSGVGASPGQMIARYTIQIFKIPGLGFTTAYAKSAITGYSTGSVAGSVAITKTETWRDL